MSRMGKNSVALEDGIIIITQVGDQTYDTIAAITEQVREFSKGLKEIKIMVDHGRVDKVDIGGRKAGFEVARHLPFKKMVFYGTSPYMTGLINLLVRATGKKRAVYFAKNRQEALRWLK